MTNEELERILYFSDVFPSDCKYILNYVNQLQQELTDYKEENKKLKANQERELIIAIELEKMQKELEDYKERNEKLISNWNELKKYTYRVIETDNELYGTWLLEEMKRLEAKILDKKDNVVTINRDMTHFFDGVAELDATPLLSSEEILKMIKEEERNRKNVDNTHI